MSSIVAETVKKLGESIKKEPTEKGYEDLSSEVFDTRGTG